MKEMEGKWLMTKLDLTLLMLMNENHVDNVSQAKTVTEIIEMIPNSQRRAYNTVYRHLQSMVEQGYVKCGLMEWIARTYYISETGKLFCNSMK